jgi:DNA-binding GntR family transcriptional regulator
MQLDIILKNCTFRAREKVELMKSKIDNVSLVDQTLDAIRSSILSGELEPGSHIKIKKMSDHFGVSMIPVREALARLLSSRLVTSHANRGYFVAARPTAAQFSEFVDARVLFETSAVRSGFENTTDADVARLRKLNTKMRKIANVSPQQADVGFGTLNLEFHRVLVGLTRNSFLLNIYDDLSLGNLQFQLLRSGAEKFPCLERLVNEHEKIVNALVDRDLDSLATRLTHHIRSIDVTS